MDRNPPPLSIRRSISSGGGSGGIILEKYQLGQILGRGSFAKVYRARSLSDDTSVAIKVFEKPAISDPTMENLLVREVAAMRRLNNHPNILNLQEVLATKTKIYLVMELAEGGELFTQLTKRGRMTETVARRYFQQLISALRFCHQNGVAHRDLKPQNLLLDKSGNLKISDFGLSALPEQLKNGLLHTACGTPAYTAPEVVRRSGYDGAKADAFSCGVILFVFLAGQLPFDDSNLANMYKKIYKREFVFPDRISKPARSLIYRLLDPNPNTRMTMDTLVTTSWYKKSLKPETETEFDKLGDFLGKDLKCDDSVNAFDIISMSSGLDLSGLFESNLRKERRFTSKGSMKDIEERVERVCGELGYKLEKGKGREMGLIKGKIVFVVRILELVTKMELIMVEMKVVSGGDELDKGGNQWEELKLGLGDIVVSWHSNDVVVEA